jgi:hypothetical protein
VRDHEQVAEEHGQARAAKVVGDDEADRVLIGVADRR